MTQNTPKDIKTQELLQKIDYIRLQTCLLEREIQEADSLLNGELSESKLMYLDHFLSSIKDSTLLRDFRNYKTDMAMMKEDEYKEIYTNERQA